MSRIATIQRNLSKTEELLRSYEAVLANDPDTAVWVQHDIRSLARQRKQLQTEFSSAANDLHVDECRYRLFRDGDNPSLAPVTTILGEFQNIVSLIFHSLDRGEPLQRSTLDAVTLRSTSFQIGYAFAGSVGFVLTLPNARMLPESDVTSKVDDSIDAAFSLARLTSPQEIRAVASQFGRPVIMACYRWAKHQVGSWLGSDVEWRRGSQTRSRLFVQYQELAALQEAIDQTSEELVEDIPLRGTLTGANVTTKTFQFAIDGEQQIHGTFSDAISASQVARLPSRYVAHVQRTRTVNYATDEIKDRYFLVRLM